MKKELLYLFLVCVMVLSACQWFEVRRTGDDVAISDSVMTIDSAAAQLDTPVLRIDSVQTREPHVPDGTQVSDTVSLPPAQTVNTGNTQPQKVVAFAQTLIGTPYVYASSNPNVGFDCSGFITYVFNHFGIAVPRSSVDFTHVGKTVPVQDAKAGDLILFTGTDSTETAIGHMGLIVSNSDTLRFIHSTSGKAMGVTRTALNEYYKKRFVRVARIFLQNDR